MDSAMRDLERIQERDDDLETRRLLAWALAVLTTLAVVLSVAAVLGAARGDAPAPERAEAADGLLAALGGEAATPQDGQGPDLDAPTPAADDAPLDPAALRFPEALTGHDERPEVAAALAAAEAELAQPLEDTPPVDAPAEAPALRDVLRALPAAAAASGSDVPAASDDPLLAAARRDDPDAAAAPPGGDGEFTLQVVSYDTREKAQAFADELRARGHRAFVRMADVPGRGRYWRVRIGPFETLTEAEAYRRSFEGTEQIATFVVRRREG